MFLAIIAVLLIILFASLWSNTPDIPTKGNPSFHKESFDEETWKNFDIHHESENHVIPEDYLEGKCINKGREKKK